MTRFEFYMECIERYRRMGRWSSAERLLHIAMSLSLSEALSKEWG